jgi:hypothetical protein
MFIIDKILLSPIYGTIWVAKQVDNAIKQDVNDAPERITAELRELYMELETGHIAEADFDKQEKVLLDSLDRALERAGKSDKKI